MWFSVLFLALAGGGGHLLHPSTPPKAQVASLKATAGEPLSLALLEVEVMRFADSYASLEAEAADDFLAKASTPQARIADVIHCPGWIPPPWRFSNPALWLSGRCITASGCLPC